MLAVDIGSGMTKFAVPGERDPVVDLWPSVVGRLDPDDAAFSYEDVQDVVVSGERWVVGEDAESALAEEYRVNTLNAGWAGSGGWLAILYRVIAHLHRSGGDLDDLTVITGLPQARFHADRAPLLEVLDRVHEFTVGGVPYRVRLTPMLVPQAFSALFWAARWDEQVLDTPSAVIDVGTYTTGYAVLQGERLQLWRSGGLDVGLSELHRLVGEWVDAEYRFRPSLVELGRLLTRRELVYRGSLIPLGEVIDQLASRAFAPLTERLAEVWRGGAADLIVYLAGGGAQAAEPVIRTVIPHVKVVRDPAFAVVLGMMEYGISMSGDDGCPES